MVGQAVRGEVIDPNTIVAITLNPGDHGREYDFCEHLPSAISGYVYHDRNDNGLREAGEEAIAGAQITLVDQDGNQMGTTQTDAIGYYEFAGLSAGTYRLVESQPSDWLDGKDAAGRVDGLESGTVSANDTISGATLLWGSTGIEYNFGELLPGTIQGIVHADLDRDCVFDPTEHPISGVKIELLGAGGAVLATTYTDNHGEYLFQGLTPGLYAVRETQPGGFFHGSQTAGSHGGDDSVEDLISRIPVGSGQHLVHYDFCEVVPGSISGIVYVDPNQNQTFDTGEKLLDAVRVQLLDATGKVVATTDTNDVGYYEFVNLRPGTYGVHEFQPERYFHGGQQAGSHGGDDSSIDLITHIAIGAGEHLIEYNFSELPPSSIQGTVYVSASGTCSIAPDTPISGVTIELLDGDGVVVGATHTDTHGHYLFDGLRPGEYSVRETQPKGYFQGGQCAGTGGGNALQEDLLTEIAIGAGQDLMRYDFYEVLPASLSGYVFQDGPAIQTLNGDVPENLGDIRDGLRTPDDKPIAGVMMELRNGLTGLPIMADQALEGVYADGPIVAWTDAQGHYEFQGLRPGSYAVYQIQPDQYIDGIDTPGSTNGLPFNRHHFRAGTFTIVLDDIILNLAKDPADDAIVRIPLMAGQSSIENNFSEVLVTRISRADTPATGCAARVRPGLARLAAQRSLSTGAAGYACAIPVMPLYGSASELKMTWHLSVVDGGMPRGGDSDANMMEGVWRTVSLLDHTQWISVAMNHGYWTLPPTAMHADGQSPDGIAFGISGATPISGDFNGDGISEFGLYYEGHWFIDINGNGRWDEEDLWAKLGTVEDLPVVGDWDGDGKDDIGIFGPEWQGDERALKAEPGLPDPQNMFRRSLQQQESTPKNLPPEPAEATDGHRVLKRTATGHPRLDVIDHVFRFGISKDLPVAGDWNGDGIRSVGVFRSGTWYLDVDGDGQQTERDVVVSLGEEGDLPVVGDFNGDGIDELGIYRYGTWMLDTNGNRELDAHDQVFRMGDADSKPVVGDWDGDGQDDPAVYRDAG